jgi:type VI protein secretion system component VasK
MLRDMFSAGVLGALLVVVGIGCVAAAFAHETGSPATVNVRALAIGNVIICVGAVLIWKSFRSTPPKDRGFEVKQNPVTTPGADEKDIDHG